MNEIFRKVQLQPGGARGGIRARQRKTGTVYSFWIRHPSLPNGQSEFRAGTDVHEAMRELRRRLTEIDETGKLAERPKMPTLTDFAPVFLADRQRRGKRAWKDEEAHLRLHILPRLGARRLDELRPDEVSDWVLTLQDDAGLKAKTVRNVHGTLSVLLELARFKRHVTSNVARGLPRGTLPEVEHDNDDRAHEFANVETLISDTRTHEADRVMFALLAFTGARLGEAAGLRWQHIDESACPLWRWDLKTQYDGQPLKTKRPRKIPIHAELQAILEEWRAGGFERAMGRAPTPGDLVAPNWTTRAMHSQSSLWWHVRRACELVGVEPKGVHAFRHFFASHARENGAQEFYLNQITHAKKGTILDGYSKSMKWDTLCAVVQCVRLARTPLATVHFLAFPGQQPGKSGKAEGYQVPGAGLEPARHTSTQGNQPEAASGRVARFHAKPSGAGTPLAHARESRSACILEGIARRLGGDLADHEREALQAVIDALRGDDRSHLLAGGAK